MRHCLSQCVPRDDVQNWTQSMAGYSGTPLVKKLGIREQMRVVALQAPPNYEHLLGDLPSGARIVTRVTDGAQFLHVFVTRRKDLERRLKQLRQSLNQAGALWISWPKKSSGVPSDVTENVVREVALPLGFVDIKVCAIDETWSGLKLVIRRELRSR
jgi:hypothetical protein